MLVLCKIKMYCIYINYCYFVYRISHNNISVENDTNVMVLSEKKNEKKKRACKPPKPAKKLTKKERRQLQQVVDRKTKKMKVYSYTE